MPGSSAKKRKEEPAAKLDASSDSDSDSSGSEDETPKKSEESSKNANRNADGHFQIVLEGKKHITVRPFGSRLFVDIREFYEANGELRPGRKGIALTAVQWNKLKSKINEIDEIIKEVS